MKDEILKNIEDFIGLEYCTEYEFRKLYGLTFAFKREIVMTKSRVSSAGIAPVGIIYEKDGQYYLAPLDEAADIEEIVREYVDKCI